MTSTPSLLLQKVRLWFLSQVVLLIPALVLIVDAWTGNLTVTPIQASTQWTGRIAIFLLAFSLIFTPLKTRTGLAFLSSIRRTVGLYSFYYALIHLTLFAVVDYGFDLKLLSSIVLTKPYIVVGLAVFLILFAMAVTSNKWSKRQLGKNWKRLHKYVYLAVPLAGLHYAWALKGDLFRLSGNIFWPVVYLTITAMLLLLRIPWIKRKLAII